MPPDLLSRSLHESHKQRAEIIACTVIVVALFGSSFLCCLYAHLTTRYRRAQRIRKATPGPMRLVPRSPVLLPAMPDARAATPGVILPTAEHATLPGSGVDTHGSALGSGCTSGQAVPAERGDAVPAAAQTGAEDDSKQPGESGPSERGEGTHRIKHSPIHLRPPPAEYVIVTGRTERLRYATRPRIMSHWSWP